MDLLHRPSETRGNKEVIVYYFCSEIKNNLTVLTGRCHQLLLQRPLHEGLNPGGVLVHQGTIALYSVILGCAFFILNSLYLVLQVFPSLIYESMNLKHARYPYLTIEKVQADPERKIQALSSVCFNTYQKSCLPSNP